jgi:hypothetical protein
MFTQVRSAAMLVLVWRNSHVILFTLRIVYVGVVDMDLKNGWCLRKNVTNVNDLSGSNIYARTLGRHVCYDMTSQSRDFVYANKA